MLGGVPEAVLFTGTPRRAFPTVMNSRISSTIYDNSPGNNGKITKMLNPSDFHDLVSGRRRGVAAGVGRLGLRLVEVPYTWAVAWRNRRYDRGRAEVHRAGVPVVSVGNITLGGTGKTPMVAWLARWFRSRGIRASIVSRGYGAEAGGQNDEARELERQLPDVPHLQNPDRVAAAGVAVEELETQLIILDDGFQHRRLARDFDIVLIDALEPFGYEHVFPRGTLREPLSGLKRADAVLLSRADMVSADDREAIRRRVATFAPAALWGEIRHAPQDLISADGAASDLDVLKTGKIAAFCGLGNPAGFRHTLESVIKGPLLSQGAGRSEGDEVENQRTKEKHSRGSPHPNPLPEGEGMARDGSPHPNLLPKGEGSRGIAAFREFPDHHPYSRDDIESLARWAEELDVAAVVCSQKDLVKISIRRLGGKPLFAMRIAMEFLVGQEGIEKGLSRIA
jgi:tetraacyldisaccharide 4'-kinase